MQLPEPPPLTLWRPGFDEWESKVMLAPRTLSVVTGHPGHGKTVLFAQIWFQVVRTYGVPICVASFETRPKPHLRRHLRTFFARGLAVLPLNYPPLAPRESHWRGANNRSEVPHPAGIPCKTQQIPCSG
jgi:hypothetical protein